MADLRVCPICHDSFDKPKFLHCGHTFCEPCLDKYLDNTNRKETIICPLCRSQTQCNGKGAQILMDNYFASHMAKSRRIIVCPDCSRVAHVQLCSHCDAKFCDACFASHEASVQINERKQQQGIVLRTSDESEEDDPSMGVQGFLLSQTTHTKFCFKLQHRIVVPNENHNDRRMNLNVSLILAYDDGRCFVTPNGSNVLINYNVDGGEELGRTYIAVDVVDLTMGIRGHPLLIGNRTNLVFECENGNLRQTIQTWDMVPFVLASLNNGNVVVLGVRHNSPTDRVGVIQIYEYYGNLVREIPGAGEGYELIDLRSVDVNMKNNDIYVGDRDTGIVHLFKERGSYISSYSILENMGNLDLGIELNETVGQMPICCCPTYDVIFVSCISAISRSIHVLSPRLELLGFFSSYDRIGIPAGLSMDKMDRLYVGDAIDGIVRVYTMDEFRNNIHRTEPRLSVTVNVIRRWRKITH